MKQLLIEEMKRAIELMEREEDLTVRKINYYGKDNEFSYTSLQPGTAELRQMLKAVRKHSILLEKGIK
jgi:hypothetical protein